MTRFTLTDLDAAHAAWGCNCAPAALATILDITLDEVRPHFGPSWPGYTNPTAMFTALRSTGRRWSWDSVMVNDKRPDWPRHGLARIQFEGPWMRSGVPIAARYKFTHWVGCHTRGDVRSIWDVNEMSDAGADGWVLVGDWIARTVPRLTAGVKRATGGWHVTHAIEVERPAVQL